MNAQTDSNGSPGNPPSGQVIVPRTMIDIPSQAIVSRILLKNASGSITLFGFDAGQELSEHTTPFEAMLQVLEGAAEVSIAGTWHTVGEGQAILMPAGVPHAVRAKQAFKMLLTMLRTA
ncbi:MAG: cupin domain-containing protein [Thermogutta sp.]|nr:cupin domain-containing protein [Thermogutta sp.]